MCKVSIIIPIYNVEKYLDKCLNSVINQSLKDIQIILVNDGSTDNSENIYSRYVKNDNRFIVIKKENGGLVSARKAGAAQIKGEYVLNVDSDDYMSSDMVETLYNRAQESNSDIAVCGFYIVNNEGITRSCSNNLQGVYLNNKKERGFIINNFCKYAYVWNKMVRRDIYLSNLGYYDDRLTMSEDLAISVPNLVSSVKVIYVDKCLYYYRQSNIQMTNKYKISTYESELLAEQKSLEAAQKAGIDISNDIKKRYVIFAYWQILLIFQSIKDKSERKHEIDKWCNNSYYFNVDKRKWAFKDKLKFWIVRGKHVYIAHILQNLRSYI